MPKPFILCIADVVAFLTNKLVEASPINAVEQVLSESLQAPGGPIPTASILGHPLGSNIQHILEDIDLESEDLVGMKDDNMGHPTTKMEVAKAPLKPLSPIREAGTTSWTATPARPLNPTPTGSRNPTPARGDRASRSKRPRTSTTFESESSVVV